MSGRSETVIAKRILRCVMRGAPQEMRVRIFAPFAASENWSCVYEIDWPDNVRRRAAHGLGAVQALSLALQTIGAELYTDRQPGIESLRWLDDDEGLGFPLPPSLRDFARGEDKFI